MLDRIKLEPSRFALHLAVLIIVALWTLPTAGLLVARSATRTRSPPPAGGRRSPPPTAAPRGRTKGKADQVEKDGTFVISGNLFEGEKAAASSRPGAPA